MNMDKILGFIDPLLNSNIESLSTIALQIKQIINDYITKELSLKEFQELIGDIQKEKAIDIQSIALEEKNQLLSLFDLILKAKSILI